VKRVFKQAIIDTIPVLTGYLVLGFGFGILIKSSGYGIILALVMSLFIYAGSMQYVAIGFLTGGVSIFTVCLTTIMVNARHIFYGISMIDKYRDSGMIKPYLIFALTDETYSLVCRENINIENSSKQKYYLLVTLFNHIYWVFGTILGGVVGSLIKFNTEGIEFALTALFLTVFVEQWMSTKNHLPAMIGLTVSILCLVIFGANFLIPTMFIIALLLCVYKEEVKDE